MRILVLALLWAAVLPTAVAHAQGDGVTYDPDSPAGREYALPLPRERASAHPGRGDGSDRASPSAPLFGAGLRREGPSSGAPTTGGDARPRTGTPASDGSADGKGGAEPSGSAGGDRGTRRDDAASAPLPSSDDERAERAEVGGFVTIGTAGAALLAGLLLRRIRGRAGTPPAS